MSTFNHSVPEADRLGPLLADWRKRRRLSQLELALCAGISSRHLSFVETGRARPSRQLLLELCDLLRVPPREANAILAAAGLPPRHGDSRLEDAHLAPALEAIRLILARHDPYPAVAFDDHWDVVMVNASYAGFLEQVPAADGPVAALQLLPAPRLNLLTLLTAPDGYRTLLSNAPEVLRAVLSRVRRELAVREADPALLALVRMWLADPYVAACAPEADSWEGVAVPVHVHWQGLHCRFISTLATLGTAEDACLQALRIEQFHPADAATEALLRRN